MLMRYAGMGMQLMALLGITVWAGLSLDKLIAWRFPLFVILLPLLAILHFLYRLVKDLSSRK